MTSLKLIAILGAFILPLAGLVWFLVARKVLRIDKQQRIPALIMVGIAAVCVVSLLLFGEETLPLPEWIPGAGPMSLHLGGHGGEIAALTAVMLFLSLLINAQGESDTTFGLLLAALTAANGSFLAGHFLFRYLALEMVGLCIGLAPLLTSRRDGLQQAKETYLLLRLGDVGLLGAILILWHASGTLNIDPALEAGQSLSHPIATWTVGGLLLAVWVKAGVWPFHRWQGTARDLPPTTGAWLYGLLMPNLGLYLLYRTVPLLETTPALRWAAALMAILGLALVILEIGRRPRVRWPASVGSIIGAIAILLAIAGQSGYLVLWILVTTPIRVSTWLIAARPSTLTVPYREGERRGASTRPHRRGMEGALIAFADRLNRSIETRIAQDGVVRLWHYLAGTARTQHHAGREKRLWDLFSKTTLAWHQAGEEKAMDALIDGTAKGAISISRRLQQLHTGKLRVNLQWAMAALILMISFLVLTGW